MEIFQGDFRRCRCKLCGENGCDFIVAGSLGKSAFDRLLLGSVSGYMVKASKTNILIVRN